MFSEPQTLLEKNHFGYMYINFQLMCEIFLGPKNSFITRISLLAGILITGAQPALQQSTTMVFHRSLHAPQLNICKPALNDLS